MLGEYDETAAQIMRLVAELGECRQRGIERLDRRSHNQAPVAAATLQRLASDYIAAVGLSVHGRVPQIKALLRHALDELAARGDDADASLVRDLFFGDSVNAVVLTAGELLENAQRKVGEASETRFRERRQTAFRAFAGFLLEFVDEARRLPGAAQVRSDGNGGTAGPAELPLANQAESAVYRQQVLSGYVEHGERFVALLAEAMNVTVVGFTNEQLTDRLEQALARKRRLSRPDAFWNSLRIVYVGTGLLDFLNDERSEYPDRQEAVRLRRLAAISGQRSLSVFLRRVSSTRWTLYETPYVPPFIGTLFEMPNGRRLVQLLMPRPQRSTPDHLFMEMDDLPDQYFTAAFEDIVHNSVSDNKVVPVGLPANGSFRCTGWRFRQTVLADHSGATGWLPLVLVITSQRRAARVDPLLQLRTAHNAARELDRLSHLSGHIYHDGGDASRGSGTMSAPLLLDIGHELPLIAAQRRVQMETGEDLPAPLQPVGTWSYLHHDKEHMFFFVYALELPEDFQFPRRAEIYRFPLPELFAIRENQALRKAGALLRATGMSARTWNAAADIVALNLVLHDHDDLAERIRRPRSSGHDLADLLATVTEVEAQTRQSWFSGGRDIELRGLSGLQYREFFTMLLPLYAELGVTGAADQFAATLADERKSAALDRLADYYRDDLLMGSLPVEL